MRGPLQQLVVGGCLACALAVTPLGATAQSNQTASGASAIELTQDELLALARNQLNAGNPRLALQLVDGLLATRPDVYAAHLIRTDALRHLGQTDDAMASARSAWRKATTDSEKTRVARLASIEAYRNGHTMQSKFWLRRALNTAQTQNEKRNIIRNYNEIRRYDPWTTQFSFAMSPSSNVNNGTQGDVYSVDGLPWVGTVSPGSQALSGYRVSLSGTARYRWRFDNGSSLSAGVRAYNTVIKFSSEAKAAAPTAEESDYDFGGLEVLLGGSKSLSKTHGLQWDLSVGRLFSGREAYSDVIRATVSGHYALKSGGVFSHSLEARKEFAIDPTRDGSEALKYTLNLSKPSKGRGTLYSSAFVEQVFSDSISTARQRGGLSATFAPSKPVFGTKANFTLGAEMTRYPDYPFLAGTYVPGGRRDKSLYGSAGFTLTNQSYFGFAPEIRINLGRTWSNVSRFDTRTSSIGLGIKSAF
ncbi:tetratricopeptide repeat protein [Celeribacter sp.]|uniref:tetratricopeptide repeat protein n=1 Tax=Celeribacter sp. TaxID=1890673 RepID=UPI003A94B04C